MRAHRYSIGVAHASVASIVRLVDLEWLAALLLRRFDRVSPGPRAGLKTSRAGAIHCSANRKAVGLTDADVAVARPLIVWFAWNAAPRNEQKRFVVT